nr:ribonuclease D [Actinomycetales bacterium]
MAASPSEVGPDGEPLVHVDVPAEGVPPIVETPDALAETVRRLREGTGPVAVDAERAAGFRYSQRAYLVQLRREGSGTHLVDPIPLVDHLHELREVLNSLPWILHAASQDLPCLRELGLEPPRLFDTELAGRLLGRTRVGLGPMVGELIGVSLAKEHSAADWSIRPIPESARAYAALDVEYLTTLQELLSLELEKAGKTEWAEQEFEHVRQLPDAAPRPDPWRRTNSIGDVRSPRGLAVVRELWTVRDAIAQRVDIAPGRMVNDRAIVALASRDPLPQALPSSREWRKHDPEAWATAYERALSLPAAELPPRRGPSRGGLPEPRAWTRVNPPAARRLVAVREAVFGLAEEQALPQENLLAPATQRRIAWESTVPSPAEVNQIATRDGARPWQVEIVAEPLGETLARLAKESRGR